MSKTHAASLTESLPWYSYPMVWFVIFLPLSVVAASIITVVIAFQNAPDLIPSNHQGAATEQVVSGDADSR